LVPLALLPLLLVVLLPLPVVPLRRLPLKRRKRRRRSLMTIWDSVSTWEPWPTQPTKSSYLIIVFLSFSRSLRLNNQTTPISQPITLDIIKIQMRQHMKIFAGVHTIQVNVSFISITNVVA
jgi:hypothetical protein